MIQSIDLYYLETGNIPAISERMGGALAEAGAICLESEGHRPAVSCSVRGCQEKTYFLTWQPTDGQAQQTWRNRNRTTEMGAEALAILIAKEAVGYSVIRQSRTGTGFDYWIGEESTEGFADKAGLEISGIRRGKFSTIRARVICKLKQAKRSKSWPTYVIIVEFGTPLAEVKKNERS